MKLTAWLLLFFGCCQMTEAAVNYKKPIKPEEFSKMVGQGFAVKYFSKYADDPLKRFDEQHIKDIYDAGFRNVRLRIPAYEYLPDSKKFKTTFLESLDIIIDTCLETGVIPIISYSHYEVRSFTTEKHRKQYINWWGKVADWLKDKDYRVGFNLYTEIGNSHCKLSTCEESLKNNRDTYNKWTKDVVKRIRDSKGNNRERILILASPAKGAPALAEIDPEIYKDDTYMMAEHHIYAGGINNDPKSPNFWTGKGTKEQRDILLGRLETAKDGIPLKTYWGAWMPVEHPKNVLDQKAVESFAKYFVSTLKNHKIPWSMNAFEMFYDTKASKWLTGISPDTGFDMSKVLNVIKKNM